MNKDLGAKKFTCRAGTVKIVINIIMAVIAIGIGVMFALIPDFAMIGIVTIILGLIGAGIIIWRQVLRSVTVYENGVGIRNPKRTTLYHYDELTDALIGMVSTSQRGIGGLVTRSYNFYTENGKAFSIGSAYSDWQYFGMDIYEIVRDRTLQRMTQQIENGEVVTFSHLLLEGTVTSKKVKLSVSKDGIQHNDEALIPWASVQNIEVNQTYLPGFVKIHTASGVIAFSYFNTRGSRFAFQLVSNQHRTRK